MPIEAEQQVITDGALVEIIDSCALTGTFWTWAGVVTDEPVELVITDTTNGTSVSHLVWTDRREVSRLAERLELSFGSSWIPSAEVLSVLVSEPVNWKV